MLLGFGDRALDEQPARARTQAIIATAGAKRDRGWATGASIPMPDPLVDLVSPFAGLRNRVAVDQRRGMFRVEPISINWPAPSRGFATSRLASETLNWTAIALSVSPRLRRSRWASDRSGPGIRKTQRLSSFVPRAALAAGSCRFRTAN